MSIDLNASTISGHLTRDPESRAVGTSTVTTFTVAHNRRWKNVQGEPKESVVFLTIEVWGRQAETCAEHLTIGAPVIVEGHLDMDQWTDAEGQKRSRLKLVAAKVHFVPTDRAGKERQESTPAAAQSTHPQGDRQDRRGESRSYAGSASSSSRPAPTDARRNASQRR